MILNFLVFYYLSGLLFSYWTDVGLYLVNKVWLRIRLDLYSVSFYFLLGFVRCCVSVWSYYYLEDAETYPRFMLLLISFISRMAALILFSNLYMTLIGWDGLGVTSFLLIIFYKNRKSLGSGMITALTNRLGDSLLLCVLGLLFLQGFHSLLLVLIVVLSITKSAQIPFSSWLPAAIAAPTPVSALVHSSTLVTAGVYVLLRYCQTDTIALLSIGSCTILMAGLSACAERDLKKVVALRTLSQLGVIMVSLGAHAKSYCFFHLMSHALFKALLFICIGSCIHVVYGTQDYRRFNALRTSLNLSFLCSVSNISLIGFAFTSGFYRKDIILEVLYRAEEVSWSLCFFLIGIGLTSFYSVKMLASSFLMSTFSGTGSRSISGHRWQVKCPLYLLGTVSLAFGCSVNGYCRALSIPIPIPEKLLPLSLLMLGFVSGYWLSRLNRPLLRSMATLTPNTQFKSSYGVVNPQLIDKGWIEACSLTVSSLSNTIYYHYRPIVILGISPLLLYLLL